MSMSAREAFERGTDAFNDHDLDGFAAVLADDVAYTAPGVQGAGKAGCVEFYGGWLAAFPDGRVDVHDVHFVDDIAIEEGELVGTHDGVLHTPAGDIPATGRSVRIPYIHVLHFREGKHVSFNLAFDRLLMLEQLGLAPEPAPVG
jgi:ketosteroid isomerase-like protein